MKFQERDIITCTKNFYMDGFEEDGERELCFLEGNTYQVQYINEEAGRMCYVLVDESGDEHWMDEDHAVIFTL